MARATPADGNDRFAWVMLSVLTVIVLAAILTFVALGDRGVPDAGAGAVPGASPAPSAPPPTPAPSTPTPVSARIGDPKDSPIHRLALPDRGACPTFRVRSGRLPADQVRPYLDSLLDCMMAIHADEFTRNGMVLTRPALEGEEKAASSPCKQDDKSPSTWAGLYCSTNMTIYYRTIPLDAIALTFVMAHEFSHHLQQIGGVLGVSNTDLVRLRADPATAPAAMEVIRRIELQADCMASSMVGGGWSQLSVPSATWGVLLEAFSRTPPEWVQSHGSGTASKTWMGRGQQAAPPTRYATCTTFAAPAAEVQ